MLDLIMSLEVFDLQQELKKQNWICILNSA